MTQGNGIIPATSSPPRVAGEKIRRAIAWAFIGGISLLYFWQLFQIGLAIRAGLWAGPNMREDMNDAMYKSELILHTAKEINGLKESATPTARQIISGWVEFYDRMDKGTVNQDVKLDYPPMRSLVLTFWKRHVDENYPGFLSGLPGPDELSAQGKTADGRIHVMTKDIAAPMLAFNTAMEGVSALSMFFLVWIWTNRGGEKWRCGNRLLLAPTVLLAAMVLFSPLVNWTLAPLSRDVNPPVDTLVTSIPFWIDLIVGFVALVGLARFLPVPYRGPACGIVAATLVWLNPPMLIDGHVWPQWDVWLPAFFLLAALLATLDLWLCAGLVLGIGCMFKGQVLFAAPVLLLAPLLAGWPMRFVSILAGLAAAAGIIVSPWLLSNPSALHYAMGVMAAGLVVFAVATAEPMIRRWVESRRLVSVRPVRPQTPLDAPTHEMLAVPGRAERIVPYVLILRLTALAIASILILWVFPDVGWVLRLVTLVLCAGILAGPWFIRRWYWPTYFAWVIATAIWIGGFAMDGKFSWWDVGFAYGTKRWQQMQLGAFSLSNLCSILQQRFGWRLHDPAMDWPWQMDLRQTLGLIYLLAIIACAIGAAVYVRRRDPRFLIALCAPWVLFPTILTQMAARYTILPAVIAASMIAVSTEMSLMGLLMTLFGCFMLGNQYSNAVYGSYGGAPVVPLITQPTFPGLAWAALLAAAVFVYCSVAAPRRRTGGEIEL
jgi:hypothetical protein